MASEHPNNNTPKLTTAQAISLPDAEREQLGFFDVIVSQKELDAAQRRFINLCAFNSRSKKDALLCKLARSDVYQDTSLYLALNLSDEALATWLLDCDMTVFDLTEVTKNLAWSNRLMDWCRFVLH